MTSVRARATAGATVVVGMALLISSILLLVVLRFAYVESVRDPARNRVDDIAASLDRGAQLDQLELEEGDDRFVQIVAGGEVVAASVNAHRLQSLAPLEGVAVEAPVADFDDEWVIVTAAAGDDRTVVVGRELDGAFESIAPAAGALAVGVPLLIAVVGVTTWWVVGTALGPVGTIRSTVASLGSTDLASRVPVPETGDEIEDLAGTMNRMLDRLEAAQRRQHRFVSDASHELRSPLAAIRQHAEVARAHPGRITPTQLAEVVLDEELRLEGLVDDLLLLTRSDEGGLGLRRQQVGLDDLVAGEVARLSTVDLDVDTAQVAATVVTGDEALLRRAIRNLLDNGVRHASRRIRITVGCSGPDAVVSVDDDGPGIPATEREEVFERFVRLDEARSADAGGAGLGLAIVAEIVAAHGGTVTITESSLGGASIAIRVPTRQQ